jgi:hypothetical protein
MSFPRKRESSFSALDPCSFGQAQDRFRRGDIVGFYFPKQELIKRLLTVFAYDIERL